MHFSKHFTQLPVNAKIACSRLGASLFKLFLFLLLSEIDILTSNFSYYIHMYMYLNVECNIMAKDMKKGLLVRLDM